MKKQVYSIWFIFFILISPLLFAQTTETEGLFVGSGDNVGIKTDSPEEKLDVNGDIRTSSLVVGNSIVNENSIKTEILEANEIIVQETGEVIQGIPAGIIFFWSGPITNIPVGWALCDGTNNTPDLSDLFILGTDNFHEPGDRGGNNFLSLTLDAMPAHAHAVIPSGIHVHVGTAEDAGEHNHLYSSRTSEDGDHSHSCVNAWVEDHREFESGNSEGVPGDQDLDTAGAGSHTHTIPPTNPAGNHTHRIQAGDTLTGSAHTHTLETTGAGAPIDKRPFFYRLAYIIKL